MLVRQLAGPPAQRSMSRAQLNTCCSINAVGEVPALQGRFEVYGLRQASMQLCLVKPCAGLEAKLFSTPSDL